MSDLSTMTDRELLLAIYEQQALLLKEVAHIRATTDQTDRRIKLMSGPGGTNNGKLVEARNTAVRLALAGETCPATSPDEVRDFFFDTSECVNPSYWAMLFGNCFKRHYRPSQTVAAALSRFFRPFYQANPELIPAWYVAA